MGKVRGNLMVTSKSHQDVLTLVGWNIARLGSDRTQPLANCELAGRRLGEITP